MREILKVMATVEYKSEHLERLRQIASPAELIVVNAQDEDAIQGALEQADVAILHGNADQRYLSGSRLNWIHCDHAGLNEYAVPELFERGLLVTSSAGRSAPVLAEHALFFMMALSFRFSQFFKALQECRWGVEGQNELRGLHGKTVGIIGMGHTGRELATRAKACGMRVLGYRRNLSARPKGVDRLFTQANDESIEEILKLSDFIVLALPLSNATHQMISAAEIIQMKRGACLINMARGALVDEQAMLEALHSGQLGGAGLDVFVTEPLPPESPLWHAPNTLITPHCTPQVTDRTARSLDIISENFRRYRAGEPLMNLLKQQDIYTIKAK